MRRDTQYSYDEDGNDTQTSDGDYADPNSPRVGDGDVVTTTYDGDEVTQTTDTSTSGRPVSSEQNAYDRDGNVTQTTDGDGNITTSHYDGDELTRQSETRSTGRPVSDVQYLYDEDGNTIASADSDTNTLLSTTSPYAGDGTLTVSTYDGDQLQEEKSTDTNVTHSIVSDVHYLYDEDGNVTQTTDGDGTITNDTYDGDEMTEQKVLSGSRVVTDTQYLYDDDGHVIQQTLIVNPAVGGEHDITVSVYNGDELMTNSVGYASAAIATTCYTYDLDGNIASEIDPDSNTTSYTYDGNANVVTMTSPLGTTSYQYDEDGNRTQSIDPANRKIVSSYEGDELTAQTWYNADGSTQNTLAFHYDADGNLLLASNNAGSYSFSYNGDQVTSQTDPNGLTLTYGYDSDGNITSLSDSQGGTETWTYAGHEVSTQKYQDTSNQLSIGFTYDGTGNITGETRYSDAAGTHLVGSSQYSYNGGEITGIVHQNSLGTTLASYGYNYADQSDRLTSKSDNGTNTAYGYDTTGQLISAGSQTYHFDANGNSNATGATLGTDNELTSDGTWNYSYGSPGTNVGNVLSMSNPTTGVTWTYTYDDANELTSATEKNSMGMVMVSASYTYDAFGNRISTAVTQGSMTTTTASSYEAVASPQVGADLTNWRLWADLGSGTGSGGMAGGGPGGGPGTGTGGTGGGATVVQTRYIAGAQPDQWLARVDASAGVSWLLTDYQGSVRLVANAAMSVIDSINYDAFGNITSQTNATATGRLTWQGGQFDSTTDTEQIGEREYSAAMQRWMETDPSGLEPDTNLYRPEENAPTDNTDPSGRTAIACSNLAAQDIVSSLRYEGFADAAAYPIGDGKSDLGATGKMIRTYYVIIPGKNAGVKNLDYKPGDSWTTLNQVTNAAGSCKNNTIFYPVYQRGYNSLLSDKLTSSMLSAEQRQNVFELNLKLYGKSAMDGLGYDDWKNQNREKSGLARLMLQYSLTGNDDAQNLLRNALANGIKIEPGNFWFDTYDFEPGEDRKGIIRLKKSLSLASAADALYKALKKSTSPTFASTMLKGMGVAIIGKHNLEDPEIKQVFDEWDWNNRIGTNYVYGLVIKEGREQVVTRLAAPLVAWSLLKAVKGIKAVRTVRNTAPTTRLPVQALATASVPDRKTCT